jgi:S1-C subfamily serine protease
MGRPHFPGTGGILRKKTAASAMICGSNRAGGRIRPVVSRGISDRRRIRKLPIAKGRHHAAGWTLLAACFICLGLAEPLRAQSIYPILSPSPRQASEHLSRTTGTRTETTTVTREKNGTGFFVDDSGHMLTAGHAAVDCTRLIVAKEGHVVAARVVAVSSQFDLALIQAARTLGLSATFSRSGKATVNDMMFAAAYDTLPGMMARGGTLANATVSANGTEAGYLAIDSNVTFGASGAPVLDGRGLVQGVISRGNVGEAPLPEMVQPLNLRFSLNVKK